MGSHWRGHRADDRVVGLHHRADHRSRQGFARVLVRRLEGRLPARRVLLQRDRGELRQHRRARHGRQVGRGTGSCDPGRRVFDPVPRLPPDRHVEVQRHCCRRVDERQRRHRYPHQLGSRTQRIRARGRHLRRRHRTVGRRQRHQDREPGSLRQALAPR